MLKGFGEAGSSLALGNASLRAIPVAGKGWEHRDEPGFNSQLDFAVLGLQRLQQPLGGGKSQGNSMKVRIFPSLGRDGQLNMELFQLHKGEPGFWDCPSTESSKAKKNNKPLKTPH